MLSLEQDGNRGDGDGGMRARRIALTLLGLCVVVVLLGLSTYAIQTFRLGLQFSRLSVALAGVSGQHLRVEVVERNVGLFESRIVLQLSGSALAGEQPRFPLILVHGPFPLRRGVSPALAGGRLLGFTDPLEHGSAAKLLLAGEVGFDGQVRLVATSPAQELPGFGSMGEASASANFDVDLARVELTMWMAGVAITEPFQVELRDLKYVGDTRDRGHRGRGELTLALLTAKTEDAQVSLANLRTTSTQTASIDGFPLFEANVTVDSFAVSEVAAPYAPTPVTALGLSLRKLALGVESSHADGKVGGKLQLAVEEGTVGSVAVEIPHAEFATENLDLAALKKLSAIKQESLKGGAGTLLGPGLAADALSSLLQGSPRLSFAVECTSDVGRGSLQLSLGVLSDALEREELDAVLAIDGDLRFDADAFRNVGPFVLRDWAPVGAALDLDATLQLATSAGLFRSVDGLYQVAFRKQGEDPVLINGSPLAEDWTSGILRPTSTDADLVAQPPLVKGGLSPTQVLGVLLEAQTPLSVCFKAKEDREFLRYAGFDLDLRIANTGGVNGVSVTWPELAELEDLSLDGALGALEDCISRAAKELSFASAPKSTSVRVRFLHKRALATP